MVSIESHLALFICLSYVDICYPEYIFTIFLSDIQSCRVFNGSLYFTFAFQCIRLKMCQFVLCVVINDLHISGPLWEDPISDRWIPSQGASNAEIVTLSWCHRACLLRDIAAFYTRSNTALLSMVQHSMHQTYISGGRGSSKICLAGIRLTLKIWR